MNTEQQYIYLLAIGLMPSNAADAVQHQNDLMPEHQAFRKADITPQDIERARTTWYFSRAVPEEMRRILDARS